jgi:flagellar protein FliO/FliZ
MSHRPLLWIPFFLLYQSSAWASTGSNPANAANSGTSNTGATWYGLVTLTLLVVLVAVILRVYKRMAGTGHADGGITVLAAKSLGPREQVVVVQVQGRTLVLGYTPSNINLLTELDEFSAPIATSPPLPSGFSSLLNTALKRDKKA